MVKISLQNTKNSEHTQKAKQLKLKKSVQKVQTKYHYIQFKKPINVTSQILAVKFFLHEQLNLQPGPSTPKTNQPYTVVSLLLYEHIYKLITFIITIISNETKERKKH